MDNYDKILVTLNNRELTQAQLADFIGVSREHVNRSFKKKKFTADMLKKTVEFFKSHNIDIDLAIPTVIIPNPSDITRTSGKSIRKNRGNSKTNSIRYVPISESLWTILSELDLSDADKSFYVFGSPAAPGRGWTGVRSKDHYFLPSPVRVKRDTVTKL